MGQFLTTEELAVFIKENYVDPLLEYVKPRKQLYGKIVHYMKPSNRYYEATFVYSDNTGYHCGFMEKGHVEDRATQDLFELVYWVLDDYVWNYASNYAAIHSDGRKNYRRLLFAKEKEFWKVLDERGYKRKCKEIEETLARYPYEDSE